MPQFVRDRVGEHDAVVLVDAARLLRLAHAAHIRQSQCPVEWEKEREREITLATATKREAHSHAVVATNVLARDQYGHVVMMRILLPQ